MRITSFHYVLLVTCVCACVYVRSNPVNDYVCIMYYNCLLQPGSHRSPCLTGVHHWYDRSHSKPTYCNVCREALHGVAWHGLSCEGIAYVCLCL